MSRTRRRWISCYAIVALLFMQLAVAAYACSRAPGVAPSMPSASIDCHHQMSGQLDSEQPGLCLQHWQYGAQHIDQGDAFTPAPFVATASLALAPLPETAPSTTLALAQERKLTRAPPLALSILHCCFRT